MNDKRPDLAKLTPAEKDALIRDLRRQVAAGQSEARVLRRRLGISEEASEKGESALLERLREAAPRRPAGFAVKLGRGLKLWQSPVVMGTVAILCAAFAIDGGIGILAAARPAAAAPGAPRARARRTQLALCRAEAHRARARRQVLPHAPGAAEHRYLPAALRHAERVGVYVQTGMTWQQVPSRPVGEAASGVIKLTDG